MASEKICPKCNGKKIIVGHCECNAEWRGTDGENGMDDCRCDPDVECPECNGTGVVQ